ncbi:MAG: hypothetical protein H6747_10755 [Deltaproteobacteria bacterium]|nr:hypothetical protein [Deltaproteobacteria bacterium]
MVKRARHTRQANESEPGKIGLWPQTAPRPEAVAERASYVPSGAHKNYPAPGWNYNPRTDATKCRVIAKENWPKIVNGLRAAIRAEVVDDHFRGDFPSRAWLYIDGVLHEMRLSNQVTGEYHGFPLDDPAHFPNDPHDRLKLAPRIAL